LAEGKLDGGTRRVEEAQEKREPRWARGNQHRMRAKAQRGPKREFWGENK
jgi:hypothetical protein